MNDDGVLLTVMALLALTGLVLALRATLAVIMLDAECEAREREARALRLALAHVVNVTSQPDQAPV